MDGIVYWNLVDGYTHSGKVTKYGVINGSYLKINDENMYSSILKVDCFCNEGELCVNATSKTDAYIGEKIVKVSPDTKAIKL